LGIIEIINNPMNLAQIEKNIQNLIKSFNEETFIYDLILAYGLPKSSVSRLRKGNLNLSKVEGEISWKKKLFFKEEFIEDIHLNILKIKEDISHNQRFVIVTDYKTILAIDTRTDENLDIQIKDLPKHFEFFLPWAGMEKAKHVDENPADIKAAEKMGKLSDQIKKDNPDDAPQFTHSLNVFLSCLLFCYFAEDTNIFEENQVTNAIDSYTQKDGSDLNIFLDTLFEVLDTPIENRSSKFGKGIPDYLNTFPYVNGGLFKGKYLAPTFTRVSRNSIINSGELDWSGISPDIFGSMFQAVIGADQRGNLGQHYTSVPNIMKVIEPLFLNDLYKELEKAGDNKKKLEALLHRIHNLKIFDPACGSGNFLIIAYKELRILEMKIFKVGGMMALSGIQLTQFYGIEIDDFAGEIAKLALWMAEHQMNVEFFKEFGRTSPTLPLKEAANIALGNACRSDWESVCPKKKEEEVYVLGNPPYMGARLQSIEQKKDISLVLKGFNGANNVDYIACWFKKATDYSKKSTTKFAFVTTNSITQGEQVAILWPYILDSGLSIYFAYSSFKWTNKAKRNAGVIIVIIGLSSIKVQEKHIYYNNVKKKVKNINPYLVEGYSSFIQKRRSPISNIPLMSFGNMANDGGSLILSTGEKDQMIQSNPKSEKFIKKFFGAREFIRGLENYCIWIEDEDLDEAMSIEGIKERIYKTKIHRLNSVRKATKKLAQIPHKFAEIRHKDTNSLIVPKVSSGNRDYIPIGFLDDSSIISDLGFAIYDAYPWHLGLFSSRMHMSWMKTAGGRLKSDYRYSTSLIYNTFPFPNISNQRKEEITQCVFRILEEREKHSELTLAKLYDPDKMPEGLRDAHLYNDEIIEKCYRKKPFESDEERLEHLFRLYEQMIEVEK